MTPLNKNLNYEPEQEIVRLWKNTYSISTIYDGVRLPGLINTNNFVMHLLFLILVIAGEIYGWSILHQMSNDTNIIVLILIAVDLSLVFPIFKLKGEIKILQNKMVLGTAEFEKFSLLRKKNSATVKLIFLKAILYGIAFVKIYFLLYSNVITENFLSVLLTGIQKVELWPNAFVFLAIATIHSFFSSYVIGHIILSSKIQNGQAKGENIKNHRKTLLKSEVGFEESKSASGTNFHYVTKSILNEKNELHPDNDPETKDKFKLYTWGILTDEQLRDLVWSQKSPIQRRELALLCLREQLDLMG